MCCVSAGHCGHVMRCTVFTALHRRLPQLRVSQVEQASSAHPELLGTAAGIWLLVLSSVSAKIGGTGEHV